MVEMKVTPNGYGMLQRKWL